MTKMGNKTMKNDVDTTNKYSSGGGQLYNFLNRNIKEFNPYIISTLSIIFLVLVGIVSYKVNTTYAVFTDTIMGTKTIEITVKSGKLDTSGANAPVLDEGMIPVYYDESSSFWKKADVKNKDENHKWYDYNSKMWANSVTVLSTNRSKYLSAEVGTKIPMADILTMQVWIPRYKYKVWNYNADGTKTSNPQEIEIMFEKGIDKTGEITCTDNIQGSGGDGTSETCKLDNKVCTDSTCNGKTYTHPAFTFGDKKIKGFWMSKFELRKMRYKVNGELNVGDVYKPNIGDVYDSFSVSFEYKGAMNMSANNNDYGFSTNTDIHMIKNMEWGAVAYLSHSKYGTCTDGSCVEVGVNNNSDFITGCGAEPSSSESSECNEYNTAVGMLASTTQNVYGVYDMSGSMSEYTMGNMVSADGKTMLTGESGFDTYPDEKYYDKYSYGTRENEYKRSKLGDGIKEVLLDKNDVIGWYTDYIDTPNSRVSWFVRGYYFSGEVLAGLFSSESYTGDIGDFESGQASNTRVVMIP